MRDWFDSWVLSTDLAEMVDRQVASGMPRALVDEAAGFDRPIPYSVVE